MSQAQGSSSQILVVRESAFKVDPLSYDMEVVPFKSEDFAFQRNLIQSEVIQDTRNAGKPVNGNYQAQGSINTELNPEMGFLLRSLLGKAPTTTGSGPYTHVFEVGDMTESFQLEKGFTDIDQYFLYTGCKCNKGSFAFKSEGFVDTSFEVYGSGEETSITSFSSTITNNGHDPFNNFNASIKEGGVSIGVVTEASFDIENNLDGNQYVIGGQGERYSLPAGRVAVTGNIKVLFENLTLYNKAKNSTETSLEIIIYNWDGVGTAGDGTLGNEKMTLLVPELLIEPSAPKIEGEGGIIFDLNFTAYYNDNTAEVGADKTSVQITLLNSRATIA